MEPDSDGAPVAEVQDGSEQSKSSHDNTIDGVNARAPAEAVQIKVNVYDLLPPSRLASFLWTVGSSVLHSGVVVGDREYAFGGHSKPGLSGVYWTKPGLVPPGGTFKCEIALGDAVVTNGKIGDVERVVKETSHEFLGPSWNLLTNNCNHFTAYLCERLTGKTTPAWLNRAASIGISIPCLIPREWLAPPDAETADGELVESSVDDDDDYDDDENTAMLRARRRSARDTDVDDGPDFVYQSSSEGSESDDIFEPRKRRRRRIYRHARTADAVAYTDSSGRPIPVSERAPVAATREVPRVH